jgi:hypothetical protein
MVRGDSHGQLPVKLHPSAYQKQVKGKFWLEQQLFLKVDPDLGLCAMGLTIISRGKWQAESLVTPKNFEN